MKAKFDVIVVGARCAGSPAAMLLARKGYRVLLVDSATFPSDTLSTHLLQPLAVARLERWGLLQRLLASGCPPIASYAFDFGPFVIEGSPGTGASPLAYCPRRTVLDELLVDAAEEAGVEVRQGFTMERILIEDGRVVGIAGHGPDGISVNEYSRIVIGADGRYSSVAEAVAAERYHERPRLMCGYYSYFSGLPMHGRFETYVRPQRGFAAAPTHDQLTMVVVGWPFAEFESNKRDLEHQFASVIELVPEFAARFRGARREARIAGGAVPNFFRKPYGAGWVLIGDAGYTKDPITAQGIHDAFRDAEACANALHEVFSGARGFDDALGNYQRARDEGALPMYELTCQFAALAPPSPDMAALLGAVHGNREAMDGFVRMNAGTISPAEFLSPANVGAIFAAARAA